jgi:uncharacterized oligopeptide transporter (OPT) family protein
MSATIKLPSVGEHAEAFDHVPPDAPPLPSDASPEQKDLHWYTHVYRGDRVPQLTFRAIAMGAMLGMSMSVSNFYTTLKVGWSFGVAITSCVLSFVVWNALHALSAGRLAPMSILENNCMQSTASAAGANPACIAQADDAHPAIASCSNRHQVSLTQLVDRARKRGLMG